MKRFSYVVTGMVRLLGVLVAFGALSAHAQTAAQNSITALNVSSADSGTTVIKVELAQPLANPPAGFTINTPPRIAFDFPNTANGLGKSVQEFAEGDLRSANIVQAGNRTRLVINLHQMLAYDTKIDGNTLLITLQGKAVAAAPVVTSSRFAEAKKGAQQHSLRDVDFRRGKNGEGRIQVDLSDPGVGIDIRQQGTTLIVDFLKTSLPRNLQRKLDVVDFATPVQGVDTFAQGDNVRMVIEPKGLWEHAAYQTDNKFIVEVKPVADDPNKLVKGGQAGYAGEKLTLNFQKIDVREALNVIADFTELNMVISDTVSGNLTLRLKDVPWDQALDIILQSRGLDMRKNGNVIQVAPREELAAKEKIDLAARQEISDLEELRTESFQLSYQKGDAMVALLASDKQRILSKRGSAVVDPRTNTLFIQDTPSRLEEARKLIKQIDVPVRQVMIEARIVEASDKFGRNLGVKLGYTGPGAVPGGGFAVGSNTPTATRATLNGSNVNLPAAGAAGTFSMILFNAAATKFLNLELTALETDSMGKIISSPRVVTADQVEANIEQGTEVPYQQASSSGATTTAFKKATLSLKVKPQITPDDNVMMDVNVTKDSVGATTFNGVPTIDTNKVTTQVLVENGGTVVIGGVYAQTDTTTVNKVPMLGDVPVLGSLFRNTNRIDNKSELLIFISPKIMKDALNLR
ncbi:fimbrial protein [Ferrigenium kumadai]|uniref:Type IV pilus biogenesis and competence protein PilQ n=1 Tax=Ferrigenium kumadai TaxID=1682490 RepID=A0AAN1SXL6_9PROT|nr:type IV pilus secretin PilQ [Ferrigenium kumadai]BBI98426.1 fimbrial protein [Ferrigenium kumadai]